MITKQELEKMVEEEANKWVGKENPDIDTAEYHYHYSMRCFKAAASFVTGILMPEISDLEDQVYHATRGKANSEYLLNHELSTLTAKVKRLEEVLIKIQDGGVPRGVQANAIERMLTMSGLARAALNQGDEK